MQQNPQLRVAHFNTSYGWGGGEQQVFELMRGSSDYGVHTTLLGRGKGELLQRCQALPDINVRPFDFGWKYSPRTIQRLRSILVAARTDLLAVHDSRAINAGVLAATGLRLPVVLHRRISSPARRGVPSRWIYKASCIHRYVGVSEAARRGLLIAGIDASKTEVVPSGLDFERIAAHPDRAELRRTLGLEGHTWFGIVGALERKKDVETFLRAAAHVARTVPDARFLIVGDGPRRRRLECLAKRIGILHAVRFTGTVVQASRWIAALDALVFPSRREGHPAVLKEAMSLCVPVIAAATPGTMEVCPDASAWFFPGGTERACAALMARVAARDGEVEARAAFAKRHVEAHFPIHKMIAATCEIYRDTLRAPRTFDGSLSRREARRGSA